MFICGILFWYPISDIYIAPDIIEKYNLQLIDSLVDKFNSEKEPNYNKILNHITNETCSFLNIFQAKDFTIKSKNKQTIANFILLQLLS